MKCPACGSEQPEGAIVCATCNAVIADPLVPVEGMERPAGEPATTVAGVPEFTYVAAAEPPSALKLAGTFIALFLTVLALYWLFFPGGNEVPDDAVVQEEMGYAISAPRGWTVLTKENYSALTKELGSRLPETLKNDLLAGRIHMGVMRVLPNGEFSPSVNVVVTNEAIPKLDEAQKDQAVKLFSAVYKLRMKDFKLLGADLLDVDELRSLKLSLLGTLSFKADNAGQSSYGAPGPQSQDLRLRFVQVVVPGNKRAYILTATSLETQFKIYERTFSEIFDSFRVTDRPPIFGAMITNALRIALSVLAVYLLYFFFAGVVGWIRR